MEKFWTWKVIAVAIVWWLIQLSNMGLSTTEPAVLVGSVVGAFIAAAILKLLYLGTKRGVASVKGAASGS